MASPRPISTNLTNLTSGSDIKVLANNPNLVTPDSKEISGLSGRHRLQKSKETPRNARYLRTGSWVDIERQNIQAYEYLCRIGEVKEWIEGVIGEKIADISDLHEDLRNGIVLAKLMRKFEPNSVKKIFEGKKLQFMHSNNINYVFDAIDVIGLPENFRFELTDLYDRKNIPKVIYCLHALSHLLYKRGLAPSINNLVGYLQFTDEQIQITQKQLDNSGIALPAFKNVRSQLARELNEPVTQSFTEIDLNTQMTGFRKIQAAARGKLTRKEWLQRDEAIEPKALQLQALCHGILSRKAHIFKVKKIKESESVFKNLQARSKGFIYRTAYAEKLLEVKENSVKVPELVALCRGYIGRQKFKETKADIVKINQQGKVPELQAISRSVLVRRNYLNKLNTLKSFESQSRIQSLQAVCRSKMVQKNYQAKLNELKSLNENGKIEGLQALCRSVLGRKAYTSQVQLIKSQSIPISQLQALCKGKLARDQFKFIQAELKVHTESVTKLQALARGRISRQHMQTSFTILANQNEQITKLQALCRGNLVKKAWNDRRKALEAHLDKFTRMQGLAHGILTRNRWTNLLNDLSNHESTLTKLQAMVRGYISRKTVSVKMEYYQAHEPTVVKIQAIFRAKMAKRAYYEVAMKNDPPVSAMRNFLHLLDDSEADFTAELELEKLRQRVVRTIRENKTAEVELNDLDIKIALLVKNRITLDEVVKSSRGLFSTSSKRQSGFGSSDGSSFGMHGSSSSTHLAGMGGFSLKGLDRESRSRLRNYQHLFYLLQTNPTYLARLLVLNKGGMGDRGKKFNETIVLTLFNFAQNKREEYLLLKLFKQSIEEEINGVNKIEEFLRGNPVFIQLAVHYNRGAKERKYLRDLLQPIIKPILDDRDLDLETDPIYRGIIRDEESKTGTKSKRKYNVSKQSALNDPDTKAAFIKHLQQLRSLTSEVIDAILASLDSMPYGVRYIAKELKSSLTAKFPNERPATIIKVVGHLVYYRYINPAITAPELFDVIETVVNSIQRKNLAEVAKMLNQVSMGKLFSDENIFLQPLNNFIGFTAEKFARYFEAVTEVEDPEIHFDIDEYLDQVNTRKPTIYISYTEIISLHKLIADNVDLLTLEDTDPIFNVLKELGDPPQLMNFDDKALGREIALVLSNPAPPDQTQTEEAQQIFLETKRQVLYVIKIQSGQTLLEILKKPVTDDDEVKYAHILDEEILRSKRNDSNTSITLTSDTPTTPAISLHAPTHSKSSSVELLTNDFLANLRRLTLLQLKEHILKNMKDLEKEGLVSELNGYQAMVNAIAKDIKNKHLRRQQRTDEFRKVRLTLTNLNEASKYLSEQKASYHGYISTCMTNLRAGKSKTKHRTRPFSRQYFHVKGLERSGKMPKFGSYKYGADELYRRGILESIAKLDPSDFGRMTLIISSDEMGVFHVEASLLGVKIPGAKVELRFDELLQAQFDNQLSLSLFDETVKVNVNLLLYLINKKFYT